jgi:hypothetical protein
MQQTGGLCSRGGATFGGMEPPEESRRPAVKVRPSRPVLLLLAVLALVAYTLFGLLAQDKSLGGAARAALVPFAVMLTAAFLGPWINDRWGNK